MKSPIFDKTEHFARGAIALVCAVSLVRALRTVSLPFQVDYGEGPLLGTVVRVARGLAAYPPSSQPPYIFSPYGPVTYYLSAPLVRLFGVHFTAPRLMVLAAAIFCAAAVGVLVRCAGGSPATGLAFGALYLTKPVVQYWLPRFRVDFIALALSLAGLWLFSRRDRWYLAVPFFVAALFCKATFLAAPAACFLYLISERDWRTAFKFSAACALLSGIIFLFLQRATGGWFAFHALGATASQPFQISVALRTLGRESRDNVFLILLALSPVALQPAPAASDPAPRRFSLPLIYFFLAFLAMLASGKLGAASNYDLEWEAALCLCAGIGYGALRHRWRDSRAALAIALPAMLAVAALLGLPKRTGEGFTTSLGCADAYQYVRNQPVGQVLSENLGAVILAGKQPLVFESFDWTREVIGAGWSDSEILALINSRQISPILLGSPADHPNDSLSRWPRSVTDAITRNYAVAQTFQCTDARFAYQPKTLPPPPR